ncbi:MAG: zinc ABC transporter substrate-binding protein [Planctomycetes bacterium]|nr:zinc ABC transporter substrate-binding protein [Planctomycetota bacterium]
MHKVIAFLVALAALALLPASAAAADQLKVVATLQDLAAIATAVGGDRVEVTAVASGVQDPHFVDPKPSYIVKLRDADLLLVNGLELEIGWVPPLVEGARNPRINPGAPGYVDCSRNIPVLELPSGQVSRAEGDVHPLGNPHYLTDPLNGKIVAETVAAAFAAAAPASADYFEERKKEFQSAIDAAMFGKELVDLVGGKKLDRLCRAGELDAFLAAQESGGAKLAAKLGGWLATMRACKGRRIVFYHRSYSYFNARFGLAVANFVELKAGIQPGPGHLAEVVGQILNEKIPMVGMHPFYDEKIGRMVAEKGGARLVMLPLGVGGVEGAGDYLKFFDVVTDQFASVFGK